MTDPATSWIEQEAIEKWWNKHRFELKQAVTVERVRLQEENEELKKELVFVRAVIEKCTPNDYARDQAELVRLREQADADAGELRNMQQENESGWSEVARLKKQVEKLERMKGVQWKKK